MNLIKAFIGVGVLALPYIFNKAGYLYGSFFLTVLGGVVYY